jgi:hypothetical protein
MREYHHTFDFICCELVGLTWERNVEISEVFGDVG